MSLVLESRLEIVELHISQTVSNHDGGAAFVELAEASSFGSMLAVVPEDLRASLRADLVAAFDSHKGPAGLAVRGWELLLVAKRPDAPAERAGPIR